MSKSVATIARHPVRAAVLLALLALGLVGLLLYLSAADSTNVRAAQLDPADSSTVLPASPDVTKLFGFIPEYIEIDDLDNDPTTSPNANTDFGNPSTCPGSPDPDCPQPASGTPTFIDWADLSADVANHRIQDPITNPDDAFGGTGTTSCLQSDHSAPDKQDIKRLYAANNTEFLYLGMVRETPNGDSRYLWLFSKNAPTLDSGTCAGNGHLQRVDLESGDVMIVARFHPPTDEPPVQVFKVNGVNPGNLLIDDAVDFTNASIWNEVVGAVKNFAINTQAMTDTLQDESLQAQVFGEAAVSMSALGVPSCGAEANLTVITRTTGSGTGTAKDHAGVIYNFGQVTAEATLAPTCTLEAGYSGSATDTAGVPITADDSFDWEFFRCVDDCDLDPVTGEKTTPIGGADVSVGTVTGDKASPPKFYVASADTYYAVLTVTDPVVSICTDTDTSNPVDVLGPISVDITAGASGQTCSAGGSAAIAGGIIWTANPTGGDGNYSFDWTLLPTSSAGAGCGDSASSTCAVTVPDATTVGPSCADKTATVKVEVDDSSALCAPAGSETEGVRREIAVETCVDTDASDGIDDCSVTP